MPTSSGLGDSQAGEEDQEATGSPISTRSSALIVAILLVACGATSSGVQVAEARIGEPTGPNAALYFTASGPSDRLIGARTEAAASIQIHDTVDNDDGTTGMQHLDFLELPEDDELVLEPGGYHLMLIGVDRLRVGDEIEVTLIWEQAGEMTLEAVEVVSPADTVGDG